MTTASATSAARLALSSCALAAAACSPAEPADTATSNEGDVPRLEGLIDEAFMNRYLALAQTHDRIAVSSTGGLNSIALVLAKHAAPLAVTLVVDDYCFSACASYLIPSAGAVEFGDDAMVAMHDEALMRRAIYQRDFGDGDECYARSSRFHLEVYERAGRDFRFPTEVYDRLQPGPARAEDVNDVCPRIHYELTHAWWFPTSEQLREFMGLEFTGSVCADDPACMRRRLPRLDMEGTVMVGDDIWTLPLN
ncbi:MAG: hypothetical protein RIA71_12770 [Oceanicaulis sp.]